MSKRSRQPLISENLFSSGKEILLKEAPLSARMRPRSLEEYVGQEHIVGEGKLLTRAVESDRLGSLILYGPPGTGKTTLAQAAVYVACVPKSNAVYLGIEKALHDVKTKRTQDVPVALQDASYLGAKVLGRGQDYKYAHNYQDHYVKQKYIPEKSRYYIPTDMGYEKKIREWLERLPSQKLT